MTKRELEIRLEIAERLIKESQYFLSVEYATKLREENKSSEGCEYAYACGHVKANLEYYQKRADFAVRKNGEDIFIENI